MLVATAALAGYAVMAALIAPVVLSGRSWTVRRPRAALMAWTAMFLSGITTIGVALVWWVGAGLETSTVGSRSGAAAFVLGWLVCALMSGMVAITLGRASRDDARIRALRKGAHSALSACVDHEIVVAGRRVDVVLSEEPFAFGMTGPAPAVVVSSGLVEALDERALEAVVQHEMAHLTMRHDLLLRASHLHETCMPVGRGPMEMHRAFGLLVELVADDRAVRHCGRAPLADALNTLAQLTGNESMALRARRLEAAG